MAAARPPAQLVLRPHRPVAVAAADGTRGGPGGPIRIAAGGRVTLDFGEERVGTVRFTVTTTAEAALELVEGEDLEEALLAEDPFPPGHWYHQPRDRFTFAAGRHAAVTPGRRAFRFVTFRASGPAALVLESVEAVQEQAPLADAGRFACADDTLNGAWAISRRTLGLCLQGFYEDGVKRDGMLWIGDYRVEFLGAWHLFADTALAARSLRMIAECRHADGSLSAVALHAGGHLYPRISYLGNLEQPGGLHDWVLANYCADFVAAVWEYLLHTGDAATTRELEPVVRGVLDFLSRVDPETSAPGRTFITDNQPGTKDWWGSRAALGFQIAAAWRDGARLFAHAGNAAQAQRGRREAGAWIARTRAIYGDPAAAATRDERSADASRSWHAHAAAALAGAIEPHELARVHPRLEADPAVRRPMAGFMEFYLLQAWLEAGLTAAALAEMRSYYGQMLRNGATTTWELVDRRESGIDHIHPAGRSHCHGWSAGAAQLLPAYVLGVRPTAPGYATAIIAPRLGGLAWAKGTVPTPRGPIEVDLVAAGRSMIDVPPGIAATLVVPGREPRLLTAGSYAFTLD